MKLLIISGLSGSGKSIALHTLEDLGYYCIDNLPIVLLTTFIEQIPLTPNFYKAAIALDVRNLAQDVASFPDILKKIRAHSIQCEIFFLQASPETLIKRFSDTYRRHPLTDDQHILTEAIAAERQLLAPVYDLSDWIIDTTKSNIHELRRLITARVSEHRDNQFSILLQSFGFKHGIPQDTEFLFDVRCLPNPHWEPHLRALNGRDQAVADYLNNQPQVNKLFDQLCHFLDTCIACIHTSHRTYLTISIGCTGGQHRSVYFIERLSTYLQQQPYHVLIYHRELSTIQRPLTNALANDTHC